MNLDLWSQESEKIATSEVFSRLQFKVGHPVEQSLQVNEKNWWETWKGAKKWLWGCVAPKEKFHELAQSQVKIMGPFQVSHLSDVISLTSHNYDVIMSFTVVVVTLGPLSESLMSRRNTERFWVNLEIKVDETSAFQPRNCWPIVALIGIKAYWPIRW